MELEKRTEVAAHADVNYEGRQIKPAGVRKGKHRSFVGGHWELMGEKQLDFLVSRGLKPQHRLLDVGCGSLRAGRMLVRYLDPGNYYGIDVNESLVAAGYEHELDDESRQRLPISNLRITDRFDADFGVTFDMAIAQSVFSHLSLNHMRLSLARVAKVTAPGARYYMTFFEQPDSFPIDGVPEVKRPMYTERNTFWYYRSDLAWAAERLPWQFNYIGDWEHPRGQMIAEFVRT